MIISILYGVILLSSVHAHGYLNQPAAVYYDGPTKTGASATVNAPNLYPDLKWNDSPENNSKNYQSLISNKRIGDLKTFYSQYIKGCPKNDITSVINVSNLKTMKWQNDEFKEGFTPSHTGPCEAWIDDTKVFTDNDCAAHFKAYPAELAIDYSACKSSTCLFEFYWTGLHEPNWQLYKACVTIKGSGGGATQQQTTQITVDEKKYTCQAV